MAGDFTRYLWMVTTHGVHGRWLHTVFMAGNHTRCLWQATKHGVYGRWL